MTNAFIPLDMTVSEQSTTAGALLSRFLSDT